MYLVRLGDGVVDVEGVTSADVVGVVIAVAGDRVVSVVIWVAGLVEGVAGRQLSH